MRQPAAVDFIHVPQVTEHDDQMVFRYIELAVEQETGS